MEDFRSTTQQRLFASDNPDEFLSGLSRAFTLAGSQNTVSRRKLLYVGFSNEQAYGVFSNEATGEEFLVSVERRTTK